MFGAFVFLVGTTLRNRLFQRLRRLRHPRYLIGFLIGIAYIWGVFLRPYPASVAGPPGRSGLALGDLPLRLASLGLTLFVARWWLFESGTPVLAFAPSEVQFLFPAPLRRRDLLTYKLVTAQMQLLISAAVVAIFSARWDQSMPMALRLVAAWVLLMTLYLHHLGASLVRVGITQTRPGTKRPLLAVAVVVVGATILLVGLARAWPTMSGAADLRGGLAAAGVVLHGAALATVLWPFRAALAPMFASAPAAWARAVAFAVPLLVAHYVWVLRMNVPFEEAAADASAALAHRIRVMRQRMLGGTGVEPRNGPVTRRRAAWFALPSSGQPSVAIVWKNIVALQRRGWRSIWPAAVFIVAMGVASSTGHGSWTDSAAVAVAAGAAWLAWALAILGPMTFQNDLRQDVAYLAVLRTYPLSGVRIVVAEVASSVIPLLVAQLGLITFACIVCPRPGDRARSTIRGVWPVGARTAGARRDIGDDRKRDGAPLSNGPCTRCHGRRRGDGRSRPNRRGATRVGPRVTRHAAAPGRGGRRCVLDSPAGRTAVDRRAARRGGGRRRVRRPALRLDPMARPRVRAHGRGGRERGGLRPRRAGVSWRPLRAGLRVRQCRARLPRSRRGRC